MKNITSGVRFFCFSSENITAGDLVTVTSKKNGDPVVSKTDSSQKVALASCDMIQNQKGMCIGFGEIQNNITPISMSISDFGQLNDLVNDLNICDLNTIEKHEISLDSDVTVLENDKVVFSAYNQNSIVVQNGDITLPAGKWIVFFCLHSESEALANIVQNGEIQLHWSQIGTHNRFCCSTACLLDVSDVSTLSLVSEVDANYLSHSKCIIYKCN